MPKKLSMPESCTKVSVAVVYDSGSCGYPVLSGRTRVLAEAIATLCSSSRTRPSPPALSLHRST